MVLGNKCFVVQSLIVVVLAISALPGSDATDYYQGTANTPPLKYGMTCYNSSENPGLAKCTIIVRENDPDLVYTADNTTLVNFTCALVDTQKYLNSALRERIDACTLERIDSTTEVNASISATRTMWYTVSNINLTSTDLQDCGILIVGDVVNAVVTCHDVKNLDQQLDETAKLLTDMQHIWSTELSTVPLDIILKNTIQVQRSINVSFDAYVTTDRQLPDAAKTPSNNVNFVSASGQSTRLGQVVYYEVCTEPDSRNGFVTNAMNGQINAPLVARMTRCTITHTYATNPGVPASLTVTGDDGCNVASNQGGVPVRGLRGDEVEYGQTFGKSPDLTEAENRATLPNCVRSQLFYVVTPSRTKKGGLVTVKTTCDLEWCFEWGDPCLYYPGSTVSQPTCGSVRRRRSDDVDEYDLQQTVETTFTIDLDSFDDDLITEPRKAEPPKECFEKKTFFAITIALGILLLIIFAIALVLFVKIRNDDFERGSSAKGFHNKAYN